jgi:hypothetical protein
MAVVGAVANGITLWRLFAGPSNSMTTDIKVWLSNYSLQSVKDAYCWFMIKIAEFHLFLNLISIVAPNEATQLPAEYRGQGFHQFKLGKNLNSDIENYLDSYKFNMF